MKKYLINFGNGTSITSNKKPKDEKDEILYFLLKEEISKYINRNTIRPSTAIIFNKKEIGSFNDFYLGINDNDAEYITFNLNFGINKEEIKNDSLLNKCFLEKRIIKINIENDDYLEFSLNTDIKKINFNNHINEKVFIESLQILMKQNLDFKFFNKSILELFNNAEIIDDKKCIKEFLIKESFK